MLNIHDLSPWLRRVHDTLILPRRAEMAQHSFMRAMIAGESEAADAGRFFSGLMWHLLDFGKHAAHLFAKRPPEVAKLIEGRSEDEDGDTAILGRIVEVFGGNPAAIASDPWSFVPHPVWIHHDALLRAAIYSEDLEWQVGTAALNVGIEALVPYMVQPLFDASVAKYGVTRDQAAWLASRAGEEEIQHGENGFLILDHYVNEADTTLQKKCVFFIDALSRSMAYGLLSSGSPASAGAGATADLRLQTGSAGVQ